jgi:hypothetical protein
MPMHKMRSPPPPCADVAKGQDRPCGSMTARPLYSNSVARYDLAIR